MIERDIEVINKLGLHARAASKLVKLTAGFESTIKLIGRGQEVDAKSIMGILMLAAAQGTMLSLKVEGADEELATSAVEEMFADCFGEGE
ncbi:MAG: HPr family phosphocarrier protein [Acidiferrobacterales bacterium]|nr:HPr family phosphocarrier protein [Acidiferrobacterales bacterium]